MALHTINTLSRLLLESSVRALVLAGIVAAILAIARVRSSTVRHASWTAVLVAMLLTPVWTAVMPAIVLPELSLPNVRLPEALIDRSVPTPAPSVAGAPARPASSASTPARPAATPAVSAAPAPPYVRTRPAGSGGWPVTLAAVYLLGVAVRVGRLVIGWRAMRRVARASGPCAPATDGPLYESPAVATPLTLGVFAPRIVVPSAWTTWSDETRRAVLAHERAHVRRRDPLISFVAHLNRCVFWFHPLAWWLERTLAERAEEACDDAGVRAVGEPGRYAEVLIAVATAVRDQGGRVAWQGLGVNGNGFLSQRIDRVVRGDFSPVATWRQGVGVGVACAAAVVLAVACRAQSALEPDPAVEAAMAAERAESDARRTRDHTIDTMTAEQAAALEQSLVLHPDDEVARAKLLAYYQTAFLRTDPDRWVLVRRPHALWFTEHRPDADATSTYARFRPWGGKGSDPKGYEAAKRLWLAHAARADVSARTLRTAAGMVRDQDAALAESMLLRGQAMKLADATWPGDSWSGDLGWLYAEVVARDAGAYVHYPDEPARDIHAFALGVERTLAASSDPALLTAAGGMLLRTGSRDAAVADRVHHVGLACIQRALELDPQSTSAPRVLAAWRDSERFRRLGVSLAPNHLPTDQQLAALGDADRFWVLPQVALAEERLAIGSLYAPARRHADEALALAPRFKDTPEYPSSVFSAHMTLALLDVREHQRPGAVAHLLAAAAAAPPHNPQVFDVEHSLLLVALLKDNERDAVVTFLERMAKVSSEEKDKLLDSAAKIRDGRMPEWYQRAMGR